MFTVFILQRVVFHMKRRHARQGKQGGKQQWQRQGECMQTQSAHRQAEHAKREKGKEKEEGSRRKRKRENKKERERTRREREREKERGKEKETEKEKEKREKRKRGGRLSGLGSQDFYVAETEKPWHRCERQHKQAPAGVRSEKEGLPKPALGQTFRLDAHGVASKCPTEASKSQSGKGGGERKVETESMHKSLHCCTKP